MHVAHAEAPPVANKSEYVDPTTKTAFPSTIVSPEGVTLELVGTGVRTVSFLAIKVYAVAFYVSQRELAQARSGALEGWKVSLLSPNCRDDAFRALTSSLSSLRTGIHTRAVDLISFDPT